MNRKWLVGGVAAFLGIVAVLALVVGGVVGRKIVPSQTTKAPPATVRFTDTLTDVSISYPATWVRRFPKDQAVRLVASSTDGSAAVSVSVRRSGLQTVSADTLPLVRTLTDDLLREDNRVREVPEPTAVSVDGLPGYRYTYRYRTDRGAEGAHVHYYLFMGDRLIQIVLQAVPAAKLPSLQSTFDRVVGSFRASRR